MMMTNEQAGYKSWFTCPDVTYDLNTVTDSGVGNMMVYPKKLCCHIIGGLFALIGGSTATFMVPGVIGIVVDAMTARKQFLPESKEYLAEN